MRTKLLQLILISALTCFCSCSGDSLSGENFSGQGGSMTRFAIHGNYLYLADHMMIQVFNIGNSEFVKVRDTQVGVGLETIFARGQYLYLGANDAMYIYSIADPEDPKFVFRYSHIISCDPVVVQGNRAYVTLRSGSFCNRGANALEIIDISDPYHPVLVANYPMASPHGLGVDGNKLFLCEGAFGLKMFDISNEVDIQLVQTIETIHAYDVIPRNGLLILTGEDGVFQFDYTDSQLQLLSTIQVHREAV